MPESAPPSAPARHQRLPARVYWIRRLAVLAGFLMIAGGLAAVVRHSTTSTSRQHAGGSIANTGRSSVPATTAPPTPTIAEENAKPGNPAWAPPDESDAWDKVRGYADHVSAQRGETVGLYVTTAAPTFHVEAYRMGWYGGAQARLVWQSAELPGVRQPEPSTDPGTLMRECAWAKSLDVAITNDWVPGVYMLKLVSADGGQSMIPLTVRDDSSRAAIMIQSSVTTWQAYNAFGKASLYHGPSGGSDDRSRVVSFDRPYDGNGSGEYFGREDSLVQQVEAMGLDVTYTTDVDTHAHPELLLNHKMFVSGAHDEYWSLEMRNGVEAARDHGVNLVFMGANASFRRIRLDPSPLGPFRHEVNYRSADEDPLHGVDDQRVTSSWRAQPAPRPESSMIGDYYECNPVDADMVIVDPSFFLFANTGVGVGTVWPHTIGNEYDRVTPEAPTPDDIHVIAHSPVTCRDRASFSDMSYYTTPSGAGVLATGTFWLEPHMGPPCGPAGGDPTDCQIRAFFTNVFTMFAAGPVGAAHPSVNNLATLGVAPHYVDPVPGE